MLSKINLTEVNIIVGKLVSNGFEEVVYGDTPLYTWRKDNNLLDMDLVCGATKIVYFLNNDWVLKFPYNTPRNEKNFCAHEYEIYCKAKEQGLENYFAETQYLGEFYGIPVFAQERAEVDESYFEDMFYQYSSKIYDKEDFETDEDYYEAVSSYEDEGMDSYERIEAVIPDCPRTLQDFVEKFEINDLHSENFGFRKGDEIVMIDFSGFRTLVQEKYKRIIERRKRRNGAVRSFGWFKWLGKINLCLRKDDE